jgi:DNA-binding XRE family transcriptional regulator
MSSSMIGISAAIGRPFRRGGEERQRPGDPSNRPALSRVPAVFAVLSQCQQRSAFNTSLSRQPVETTLAWILSTTSGFDSPAKQFIQRVLGLHEPNGISGMQCRMARAGRRWSLTDKATRANIGRTSIVRIEAGAVQTNPSTLTALRRAFEAAGVEFLDGDGVRIRKPKEGKPDE